MSTLKAFQKFSSSAPPKHGNSKPEFDQVRDAIRSLKPGEAVPIPIKPLWEDALDARQYISQAARRYHGGNVTTRLSGCRKFFVIYRKA